MVFHGEGELRRAALVQDILRLLPQGECCPCILPGSTGAFRLSSSSPPASSAEDKAASAISSPWNQRS